jgi:hypothetical protein
MSAEMGPPPETEHHHHHHTGHRWLDATLAVSAVFISLMSLFLAIQHGRVMEKMVEANTWPFVMVYFSTSNPDATPHVSIHVANKGIGPAKIESLEVFDNGVAQPGTQPLLRAMLKSTDPSRHIPSLQSDVVDEVMAAREDISILDLDARNFTPQETDLLRTEVAKLTFRVCYCSVFDECSVLDTRKDPPRPVSIKACAVPEIPFGH